MKKRTKTIKATGKVLELIEPYGVTVDDIGRQLDEDRDLAHRLGNPGAAIHATMGKAKLYGLIPSQTDVMDLQADPKPMKISDLELARRLGFIIERGAREADAIREREPEGSKKYLSSCRRRLDLAEEKS